MNATTKYTVGQSIVVDGDHGKVESIDKTKTGVYTYARIYSEDGESRTALISFEPNGKTQTGFAMFNRNR